ncbi:hypothetical protein H4582DRAFT_1894718 [Lactarius indigo]|nr:hypothetical protein H4582DRAFT_1894718 [Lactarius indigo]
MAPKRSPQSTLTKAEGLLFLIAVRLLTAFRYKEANPGGDFSHFLGKIKGELIKVNDIFNKYDPTPPSTRHRYHSIIKIIAAEWESAVKEQRTFNFGKFTGKYLDKCCARTASDHPEWPAILYSMDLSKDASEQAPELQWWILRPDEEGKHTPSSPPPPASNPPSLRRSARVTKGKALLPLHPLDIKIGDNQPRGTNRSAERFDEASNDNKVGGSEPPPQKVVTPAGGGTTRATFKSPRETRLERRRRVDDSLNNTEAAQDAGWVAVGEDRCNPCMLVGREVCIPERNASKSCLFCTGQSWSCNPPDSWLEKLPRPKQARPKPPNDVPTKVGRSSKTAAKGMTAPFLMIYFSVHDFAATHHTTEVAMAERQSGHQRGGGCTPPVCCVFSRCADQNLVAQAASDLKVWLRALCDHEGIAFPLHSSLGAAAASAFTHATAPSPVTGSSTHTLVPQSIGGSSNVGIEGEEPSQEAASQTGNNRGIKRARPDELMGSSSTPGHVRCESCSHRKFKCAQCRGKKSSNHCARCQDSNHPCEHLPPTVPSGRRKGTSAGQETTAQPSLLALPITDPNKLLGIDLLGIDRMATMLYWRTELARSQAAYEAACAYKEFVEEKHNQFLERLAASGQSTAGEPLAKRAKTNTSRKGKR